MRKPQGGVRTRCKAMLGMTSNLLRCPLPRLFRATLKHVANVVQNPCVRRVDLVANSASRCRADVEIPLAREEDAIGHDQGNSCSCVMVIASHVARPVSNAMPRAVAARFKGS